MSQYECFIRSGYSSVVVDADSKEEAAQQASDIISENLGPDQIEVSCLEDIDEEE